MKIVHYYLLIDIHSSLGKSLMVTSIVACISSIVLVILASLNCCCGRRSKRDQHA